MMFLLGMAAGVLLLSVILIGFAIYALASAHAENAE